MGGVRDLNHEKWAKSVWKSRLCQQQNGTGPKL